MRSGLYLESLANVAKLAVLLGTTLASGCAGISEINDPQLRAHLPEVEVEIPGQRPAGGAPLWRAAASSSPTTGANPASASSPSGVADQGKTPGSAAPSAAPLAPLDELRQTLAGLLAQGAIDRRTHDELLQNADAENPEMLKHLIWMCRVMNRPADESPAKTVTDATTRPPRSPVRSITSKSKQNTSPPPVADDTALVSDEQPRETPARATTEEPRVQLAKHEEPVKSTTVAVESRTENSTTKPQPTANKIPTDPADWRGQLADTITHLEHDAAEASAAEQQRLHAQLRLLYLAAGRKSDAMRPLPGLGETEQDFWSNEVFGLAAYLDHEREGDRSRRAAEAGRHLGQAVARLSEASPLAVKNLAFCSEVASYGVYTSFNKLEFKPSQQVLLYAEVENFRSDETPKGFHTALKSHYQIIDSQGRKVEEHEFAVAEERCQNVRRDYFVRYFLTLPSRIYDGRYTLQLTVEDTLGKKVGQSTIDFSIKSK